MNISWLAYQRRPLILLLMLTMMGSGAYNYFTLPAQEDPSITIRESIVSSHYPGLSAEHVEVLMTKPLEEAMLGVKGIEEIRSTSSDGLSVVYVKAYDDLPAEKLAQTWDEVEEAAKSASDDFPEGASYPSVNDDYGDVAIITLALTGNDYSMGELFDFSQYVRDRLNSIAGTRNVDIIGAQQERIYIEVENVILAEAGLSPDFVVAALQAQNIITPSGVIDTGSRAFSLLTTGDFKSVDQVKNLLIRLPEDGAVLKLSELVNISKGYADPSPRSAIYNGKQAIVLAVTMQTGQSVINYSNAAKEVITELQQSLPLGLDLDVITWQADQVENAIYGVSGNVLQTLGIVLGVVILFLGLRTGLIVGFIVPAVVLATLMLMGFTGIAIERMSLATMVIALGLLVDNGVVIAEDFKRRFGEHGDRDRALSDTGKELAIPLLSSSLTTILVFTPLMLAQHPAGEYTRSISLVILITLSISWFLAMTVTPMLCHMFVKNNQQDIARNRFSPGFFGKMERVYETILRGILARKKIFAIAMFLLLPLGLTLVESTPKKFFPDSDRDQVLVYVNLPAGVTTRTTEERIKQMMAIAQDEARYPEITDAIGYVGFGGPRFVLSLAPLDQASHVGFIVLNTRDRASVDAVIPRLRNDYRAKMFDVEARVSGMFLGPSDPNVIQIQIKGNDAVYIQQQAEIVEQLLSAFPGTIDIWSNWFNPVTRFDIQVDQQRALQAGVTSKDIASGLSSYVSGSPLSEYRDQDEVYPIMARAVLAERINPSRLETVSIFPGSSTQGIPLSQVAEIRPVVGFSTLQREDLTRTVTVEARNLLVSPEDMAPLLQAELQMLNDQMKPGHYIEFDGIVTDSKIGVAALFAGFPLCLVLVVLILVAQFNGYLRPLIVLLTIPLIILGVGIGLRVMEAEFGFLVILGLFSLAGIIVNNAIVLIDRIDIERKTSSRSDYESVVRACVRRLRPILITTITTIVGLLPLIIGQDVLFYGMASIMAFGLAIGTTLTLGVVPALYCIFFKIERAE